MKPTAIEKMIAVAKSQILLYRATHKKKRTICQWCFENPAIEGKTVCQACIDAASQKETDNFDLDKKRLEGDKIEW